jgi:hypothetical protein
MLVLKFEGWFQCRLSTDPDPADEPRGVSGFTFALPGEPDLDRIIRFQPPGTVQRSHCPDIGVYVTDVYENGTKSGNHPLARAQVDLLEEPKFLGENGIISQVEEPIVPFHIRVSGGGLLLSRPHADVESFPFHGNLFGKKATYCPGEVGEATGTWDTQAVWTARMEQLQRDHDAEGPENPEKKAALQMRIKMFRNPNSMFSMRKFFRGKVPYFIPLGGTPKIEDPNGVLATINPAQPWSVDLWMGGWDTDALSGFVRGFLTIPFVPP